MILGFTVTTLLTVVFGNIQALGGGIAAVNKNFVGTFNSLPMLAIALIGFALAILYYKRAISSTASAAAPKASSVSDEGEITDDEL